MATERDKAHEDLFLPLEELLSDDEESDKLREIASGLANMEKAEFSSSYRDELRSRLLQKARLQHKEAAAVAADTAAVAAAAAAAVTTSAAEPAPMKRESKGRDNWLTRLYNNLFPGRLQHAASSAVALSSRRIQQVFTSAATILLVAVLVIYSIPMVEDIADSPVGGVDGPVDLHPPVILSVGNDVDPTRAEDDPLTGDNPGAQGPETGESPGETSGQTGTPSQGTPQNTSNNNASDVQTGEEEGDSAATAPAPEGADLESDDDNPSLPGEKPVFQIDGNLRTPRLAGALQLQPFYAAGGEEGNNEGTSYENVAAALKPNNKFLIASIVDANKFGSRGWAAELLLNQGFTVRDADRLEIVTQDTQQGLFAEISYQPGGSGSNSPVLIVNCAEDKKILGYYYQENGANQEAGYYSLLTPTQALKSIQQHLTVYSTSQPSLTFREVAFTFASFTLVVNGVEESVTLPAYYFLGQEETTKSEVKIYLPAISW